MKCFATNDTNFLLPVWRTLCICLCLEAGRGWTFAKFWKRTIGYFWCYLNPNLDRGIFFCAFLYYCARYRHYNATTLVTNLISIRQSLLEVWTLLSAFSLLTLALRVYIYRIQNNALLSHILIFFIEVTSIIVVILYVVFIFTTNTAESTQRMQTHAKADHACCCEWLPHIGFPYCSTCPIIVGFPIVVNSISYMRVIFSLLKMVKTNSGVGFTSPQNLTPK